MIFVFVIAALILLAFSLLSPFITATTLGVSIPWRGTGYVIPPRSVCIALATLLCFFATIYSFWMLPFNRTAALWHFWLTSIGIAMFCISFYRAAEPISPTVIWSVLISLAAVLVTQAIFVWNVIQAIAKMPRVHG